LLFEKFLKSIILAGNIFRPLVPSLKLSYTIWRQVILSFPFLFFSSSPEACKSHSWTFLPVEFCPFPGRENHACAALAATPEAGPWPFFSVQVGDRGRVSIPPGSDAGKWCRRCRARWRTE